MSRDEGKRVGNARRLAVVAVAALVLAGTAHAAAPPASAPETVFPGENSSQFPGANPADVQVAAGPSAVLETVNSSLGIWSPTGQPVKTESLDALVAHKGDEMTDPRVLYDAFTGRFFLVVFDLTRSELDVAVTRTADATGSWTIASLPSRGCPDQPRLGTSNTLVVVTDDLFSSCRSDGVFLGGEVSVIDKTELVAGATAPRRSQFGPDDRFASITPVTSLSATNREYLVAIDDGTSLRLLHVDSPDDQSIPFLTIPVVMPIRSPPAALQSGSVTPVDTGDNRVQNAVADGSRAWLTAAQTCPEDRARSCVRVLGVDTTTGAVVSDTTLESSTESLFYPALVPDTLGNVVVAFIASSPGEYPSVDYTYVRPDGVVAPRTRIAAGDAPNTSGRFGDYSGAARDPSDGTRVWIAAEVGKAVGDTTLGWSTEVAAVRVPPQAPAVATTSVARSRRVLTVRAEVYPEGAPVAVRVQYGTTRHYGHATPVQRVSAVTGAQAVVIRLPALRRGRTYHVRVVARSVRGSAIGSDRAVRLR